VLVVAAGELLRGLAKPAVLMYPVVGVRTCLQQHPREVRAAVHCPGRKPPFFGC
jgi:hypothetical protein